MTDSGSIVYREESCNISARHRECRSLVRPLWAILVVFMTWLPACSQQDDPAVAERPRGAGSVDSDQDQFDFTVNHAGGRGSAESDPAEAAFARERREMVTRQLMGRDITDQRVLDVMSRIPRHRFVPEDQQHRAYADSAVPIGQGQTISQPYIVAIMTQLVDPQPTKKALDIGTGSGYQAAVLAKLVREVYSIEIVGPLARDAEARLRSMGYTNVHLRHGDGYRGWPQQAPFDIIIVAAAPDHIPQPLVEQLAPGGKMIIPVGEFYQKLILIEKSKDGRVTRRKVAPVAFVPMTGEAQK